MTEKNANLSSVTLQLSSDDGSVDISQYPADNGQRIDLSATGSSNVETYENKFEEVGSLIYRIEYIEPTYELFEKELIFSVNGLLQTDSEFNKFEYDLNGILSEDNWSTRNGGSYLRNVVVSVSGTSDFTNIVSGIIKITITEDKKLQLELLTDIDNLKNTSTTYVDFSICLTS